jgi:hypothetical protein
LIALIRKTPSSNDYSIEVGATDKTFKAYFKTENLKMIVDDYDVAISSSKDFTLCKSKQKNSILDCC